ncbi:hypothetical protein SKAU_G00209320 [Synaphobranchus kaupii]|uniref:Uncharacterized protein n=1 Tax=Synaphobranchus kaupii TaxID=118154 RepID=A0A9Q1F8Q1_SYNKA|nr:hypothetical protein SKAU_G00209320 [Synaphobranchus kaupii]
MCLLLSGDIHPCPGPLHTEWGNGTCDSTPEATRSTAVIQVRDLCLDNLPFGYEQQSNIYLSGDVGDALSLRSVGAGAADLAMESAGQRTSQAGAENPNESMLCPGCAPTASLGVPVPGGAGGVGATRTKTSAARSIGGGPPADSSGQLRGLARGGGVPEKAPNTESSLFCESSPHLEQSANTAQGV